MKIFITGSAGFIGFSLSKYLLKLKYNSLDLAYDINLKKLAFEYIKKT